MGAKSAFLCNLRRCRKLELKIVYVAQFLDCDFCKTTNPSFVLMGK